MVWQDRAKRVNVIELTVCFETNFDDVKRRKIHELIEEAEHRGYQGSLITTEVGSQGILNMAGLEKMKSLVSVGRNKWATFLVDVSRTAMEESHKIWTMRNWKGQSENIHVP